MGMCISDHLFLTVACHFSRQDVPVSVRVFVFKIMEKFIIASQRVLFEQTFIPAVHIIRVGIQKSHAAFFGDPVQLVLPDVDGLLLQDDEESRILRESVGEFDKEG